VAEIRNGRTYYGRVWVEGEYKPPVFPSALSVRVGEPGVKVVDVIRYLRAYDNDAEAVVKAWSPDLTVEDVKAALEFYALKDADRQEIDAYLSEHALSA